MTLWCERQQWDMELTPQRIRLRLLHLNNGIELSVEWNYPWNGTIRGMELSVEWNYPWNLRSGERETSWKEQKHFEKVKMAGGRKRASTSRSQSRYSRRSRSRSAYTLRSHSRPSGQTAQVAFTPETLYESMAAEAAKQVNSVNSVIGRVVSAMSRYFSRQPQDTAASYMFRVIVGLLLVAALIYILWRQRVNMCVSYQPIRTPLYC